MNHICEIKLCKAKNNSLNQPKCVLPMMGGTKSPPAKRGKNNKGLHMCRNSIRKVSDTRTGNSNQGTYV